MFLIVTAGLSGLAILVLSTILEWIGKKVAADQLAGLNRAASTVAFVAVATAVYMFIMTRPGVVGPYEQFTLENIGGQLLGGVLAAGLKLWMGGGEEEAGADAE